MLLIEAIEALCLATRADGASPATVAAYREKLSYLVLFLGNVLVESITVHDLRRYVVSLWDSAILYANHPTRQSHKGSLSPFTIAGRVRAFKRLFNFLVEEGIITENPAQRIRTPAPKRVQPKGITEEDFLKLLDSTEGGSIVDLRDRSILLFLRDSACRVAGLCGLRVQDVDLDERIAEVCEKGDKIRSVYFLPRTSEALHDWLKVRPTDKGDRLFVGLHPKSRGGLSPRGVSHMLRRRGKRAGVTGPHSPHSFRHAFARDYLLDGGDLASLADIMGHEGVEVTKRWYGHFTRKQLQAKHAQHSPVARLPGGGKNDE